jgi:DNA-binding transcriptional LysR family regulator
MPDQLARHACLVQVTPAGAPVRWRLVRAGDERTVDVAGPVRSNAPVALHQLAQAGAGLAYLPDWLVADDLARGALRRVLPGWSGPPLLAWAVSRGELRGAPRLRAFLEALPRAEPQVARAARGAS